MSIYAESFGAGPDVVMLHGWGMHSGVWRSFAELLARNYRVTVIDLPGHGRSHAMPENYSLENVAALVLERTPENAHWLGWSLGGLVAMHVAITRRECVDKLVLIASTPQFVASEDWATAMHPDVLAQFASALRDDYRATLLRFLALETQGSATGREELRTLRHGIFDFGEPNASALRGGLDILRGVSLRAPLADVTHPTLLLLGQRDALVPASAAGTIGALFADAHLKIIPAAGHAPFLSQPDVCATHIHEFLQ